ncbi:NAD-dependent epimerase/dehydratase family protein [Flavobacteriaceae bacterium Ap0902]|nr:NAD-dependent epimerase/dehydratase family protein [Flavobacteriaceae bacterium Ap0902]
MKNFLVTGGAGFIGSHVVEYLLKEGNRVVVLDNFHDFYDYQVKLRNIGDAVGFHLIPKSDSKDSDILSFAKEIKTESFELIYGDIRDQELLEILFKKENFDMVIHLAALAGVRPSIDNPLEYESVNVKGTMVLWEICKKYKVNKFICASSSSVYGNNKKTPFKETDIVDFAISPYAATKKSTEVLGHVYHKLYDIDMLQLRFFTVYGPRQRPDLAIHKFTHLIDNGKEIPFYGDGDTARDYTYIEDIIDGISKSIIYLIDHDNVYEVINLGESEVVSLIEMIATIEYFLDKKAEINRLPMQPGDVLITNADITKAKEMLAYNPKTTFKQGIEKFIDWYKEHTQI